MEPGPTVFISYRRDDAQSEAARLADELREHGFRVFMDYELRSGQSWPDRLRQELERADALLAVIGPDWLRAQDEYTGVRRLDRTDDFVRREIETALLAGKRIVPILVRGARPLPVEALPESLMPLGRVRPHKVDASSWRSDIARLLDAGFGVSPEPSARHLLTPTSAASRARLAIALGIMSAAAAAIPLLMLQRHSATAVDWFLIASASFTVGASFAFVANFWIRRRGPDLPPHDTPTSSAAAVSDSVSPETLRPRAATAGGDLVREFLGEVRKLRESGRTDIDFDVLLRRLMGELEASSGSSPKGSSEESTTVADPTPTRQPTWCLGALVVERSFFFAPFTWTFRPGINVLLGRNGYGKSLILRSLATLLDRADTTKNELVGLDRSRLRLQLERDDEKVEIGSDGTSPLGRVPLLAIPDTRFFDRRTESVGPSEDSFQGLRDHGAYHFLTNEPYGDVVKSLVYEICLDYCERGQSFDLPVFQFFRKVFHRLTGQKLEFKSIERSGRSSFDVRVLVEGADVPVQLRHASQGTMSVIAMFGLVRAYLQALYPDIVGEELLQRPAIVIIDELDAHLHPQWQMKIAGVLRETFPQVQFVVSAHSPLVAAGSLPGELAVLRKRDGFRLEQTDRDFVGASAGDLYEILFDIDEVDDAVLRHPAWQPMSSTKKGRLELLLRGLRSGTLSGSERLELAALQRETAVRELVADVRVDRGERAARELELEAEVQRLRDEITQLRGAT